LVDTVLAAGALIAIGLPLLAALGLVVPALRPIVSAWAAWTPVPALVLALVTEPGRSVDLPWLLLGARLRIDDTSRAFLLFTAALWIVCGQYARTHLTEDRRRHHFLAFFLVSMAGNIGVTLAADMITFYSFFALMSFASYGLIVHERDAKALSAGRVYIAFVIAGEILLFIGIVGTAGFAGHSGFSAAGEALSRSPLGHLMLALIVVGFAIKTGTVPLHMWLPLAHSAAPTPASAVLSGLVIKAGLLGWLRFLPLGAMPLPALGAAYLTGGLASAFWGVAVGLAQKNPKTALAYSSISQMGLMTTGVGIGLIAPESWVLILPAIWIYALHHAFAKATLFLGVGVASRMPVGGWRHAMIFASLILPAFALAGVPLSSGGVAKIALKKGIESAAIPGQPIEVLLSIAAIGTTLLMARFLVVGSPRRLTGESPAAGLWLPCMGSLAGVALLVWALPWTGFRHAAFESLAPAYLWATLWPPAVGIAIAAAVWRSPRLLGPALRMDVPPGDLLALLPMLFDAVRRTSDTPERPVSVPATSGRVAGATTFDALAGHTTRMEAGFQQWGVVGALILALIATLSALLAA
jgi:formate hydrogenlyase subunit 3/multisubunit Na+/H+ antiporter MnhD subunit